MSSPIDIRARLDAIRGPGIARAQASVRSLSKARASLALGRALEALRWSQRQLAEHLGTDEKTIRMWLEGAQQPDWVAKALPRDGYLAFVDAMLDDVPPSAMCANG